MARVPRRCDLDVLLILGEGIQLCRCSLQLRLPIIQHLLLESGPMHFA
jgi:hypothetical protein